MAAPFGLIFLGSTACARVTAVRCVGHIADWRATFPVLMLSFRVSMHVSERSVECFLGLFVFAS